jgi:quercetin dioxygenase-like cupin family protein
MQSRKRLILTAGLVVGLCGVAGYAAVFNVLTVGTNPDSQVIDGPATVTFRQLIMSPGEVSAWHYHPGTMISVVRRGSVTVEDGCGEGKVHTQGQAFESIGGRVHRAIAGGGELEEFNTFIMPEGMPPTVPVPERRCGPPLSTNECRNESWADYTHPRRFSNQGDCIQYVRNTPGSVRLPQSDATTQKLDEIRAAIDRMATRLFGPPAQ